MSFKTLFQDTPYPSIHICGVKQSGKTTLIWELLKQCCHQNTVLFCFAPDLYENAMWKVIRTWASENKITNEMYNSTVDKDTGANCLYNCINIAQTGSETDSKFNYVFVLDDMFFKDSEKKLVTDLLQKNRNHRTKVIVSGPFHDQYKLFDRQLKTDDYRLNEYPSYLMYGKRNSGITNTMHNIIKDQIFASENVDDKM
jgi:hypothetical protein